MRQKIQRRLLSALAVAAGVTTLAAGGLSAGIFDGFQRRAADSLFPSAKTADEVIVVGIDQPSVNAAGFPVPRGLLAEVERRLGEAGASVIAWDVLFSTPREGDEELAAAFAAGPPTVLIEAFGRLVAGDRGLFEATRLDGAPLPVFADTADSTIAHPQIIPDPSDGVTRTIPLLVDYEGAEVPALSLEALRALRGQTGPLTVRPDGVQVGDRFIPTEGRHQLRLNFSDDLQDVESPRVISMLEILEGTVSPSVFRDKVVFIGATSPLQGDSELVPIDKSNTFPGVMVHANAFNTMMTASYIEPVSDTENVLWIALLTLLVALAVLFLHVWLSLVLTFVVALVYGLVGMIRFDQGDVVNIVYTLGAIAVTFVIALGVRYVTETRQRRRVSSLFAQYVPEEVARQLEESGHLEEHVDGERLDVGLFFCDLRGFTSLSATLEPHEVRAMLNHFYELVTEAILARGGTVLKFVGDEVFAVFGAPLPVNNHAQASLDCAMDIQRRAPELDAQLAGLGIPPVKFGIGMNVGDVVAAHVGGGKRRQYDVVGDTVNLASRLCGQAGKGEIVLPEAMIARLPNPPEMEPMGAVALKGLEEPVMLFKVTVGESEPRVVAQRP